MVTLIFVVLVGLLLIVVLPGVVGVVDARQAPRWRDVAAERRMAWESEQFRDENPTGPQPVGGRR